MMEPTQQPSSDWVVAVHSGPSSSENLLATLVAWARWRHFDPKSFSLWYEAQGRVLVLRGFDIRSLTDFLSYARSQSIPPLISGPPSQRLLTPTVPLPSRTAEPPAPAPAPPPPTDSSPLLQGVLQVITERGTYVSSVERWLMQVLETTSLKETDILWTLYLLAHPDASPSRVALASTPSLREGAVKILGVPEPELADKLVRAPDASPEPGSGPAPGASLEVTALHRALEGRTHFWQGVKSRLESSSRGEGRMTAAVVLDEDGGKVTWVFPRSPSPMVRAMGSVVLHAYEESLTRGERGAASVASTAGYASRVAKTAGISLRWYLVTAELQSDVATVPGSVGAEDLRTLIQLLGRFGGYPAYLRAPAPAPAPVAVPVPAAPKAPKPRKAPAPRKPKTRKA